jgi:hypothetical protein
VDNPDSVAIDAIGFCESAAIFSEIRPISGEIMGDTKSRSIHTAG